MKSSNPAITLDRVAWLSPFCFNPAKIGKMLPKMAFDIHSCQLKVSPYLTFLEKNSIVWNLGTLRTDLSSETVSGPNLNALRISGFKELDILWPLFPSCLSVSFYM